MLFTLNEVDKSWHQFFQPRIDEINSILKLVSDDEIAPRRELVFRAFTQPIENVRVVIFGQDPYPGADVADGLAFSSQPENPIPASLRNIFKEYVSDLGFDPPLTPDLSPWSEGGVLLLNRSLTTSLGERNAHLDTGWNKFTLEVATLLASMDVIAILWGNFARELSPLFKNSIQSPHPSPLSAHRGFFGSKPFSECNRKLASLSREPINWKL